MGWLKCFFCRLLIYIRVKPFLKKFPLKNDDIEIINGLTGIAFIKVKWAAKKGVKGFVRRLCEALKDC